MLRAYATVSNSIIAICLSILLIHPVSAQDVANKGSGLTITGSHTTKIVPTKLRLNLPIRVENRNGDALLKSLSSHRTQLMKDLTSAGVSESAIEFTSPVVSAGVPGIENPEASKKAVRQQAIQMRNMNPHMKAQFPVPDLDDIDELELPVVYAAITNLKVDWDLKNGLDEEGLMLSSKLKRMMEEKDFKGKKLRVELNEDEQSLIEPLMGNNNYYVQQGQTSEQNFYYVGELTEEQEKTAYAEAIKKAKSQAALIAASAGLRLGKIRSLQSQAAQFSSQGVSYVSSQGMVNTPMNELLKNDREAISANPNDLRKVVSVSLVFELE